MYKWRDYSSEVSDKTFKLNSKNKHAKSPTHNELGKCIRIKHTFKNSVFFDMDEKFSNYNIDHNRKLIYVLLNMILN